MLAFNSALNIMASHTRWLHWCGGKCDWLGDVEVHSWSGTFNHWITGIYCLPSWSCLGVVLSLMGGYGGHKQRGDAPLQIIRVKIYFPWLTDQTLEHKTFCFLHNQSSYNQLHFSWSWLTSLHFMNSTIQSHTDHLVNTLYLLTFPVLLVQFPPPRKSPWLV